MANYYVIFGAMVRPDGSPSGTLRRRVEGALAAAGGAADSRFIVTGGKGRHGPPEADVMARLLIEHGVSAERIERDRDSGDTLGSVRNCARLLEPLENVDRVWVCSSRYHNPRCALLFRLFGIPAHCASMPADREALGTPKWLFYVCREAAAIPWDVLLALLTRHRHRT